MSVVYVVYVGGFGYGLILDDLDMRIVSRYVVVFFFQAEDGIRDLVRSRGLGDVYKRQIWYGPSEGA